jgi:hypothetical protein
MKKLLIFFVLLSSISSFGQVQRPKMNPATLNWLLPFSITKQAYHATDSAVYSSPSGVIYKAPIQVGTAFDTTTYQATNHIWSKSNIFVNDTVGNDYPVLKRNAVPTENGLFYWNNNSKRAVTSSNYTFDGTNLFLKGIPEITHDASYTLNVHSKNVNSRPLLLLTGYNGQCGTVQAACVKGTYAAPQAITTGLVLGRFEFAASNGTSNAVIAKTGIRSEATETWSGTKCGSNMFFYVCKTGTSTSIDAVNINNDGTFETYYGQKKSYGTITSATYTLDNTYYVILVDATSNSITVNLPAIATSDKVTYVIKRIDNTANTVTIDGNLSETIDGNLTISLNYLDAITIICKSTTGWFIL